MEMEDFPVRAPTFLAELDVVSGDRLDIAGEEARHILKSRRMQAGQEIFLTNGRGILVRGEITSCDNKRDAVQVEVRQLREEALTLPQITLACAVPKGDRQSTILGMTTQLGVDRIIPLDCDYSTSRFSEGQFRRWKKLIDEAGKQSRRSRFPELCAPVSVAEALDMVGDSVLCLIGDPAGDTLAGLSGIRDANEIMLLVGPEGGFSRQEILRLEQKNILKLRLGNHILRTETAAVAMVSLLAQLKR